MLRVITAVSSALSTFLVLCTYIRWFGFGPPVIATIVGDITGGTTFEHVGTSAKEGVPTSASKYGPTTVFEHMPSTTPERQPTTTTTAADWARSRLWCPITRHGYNCTNSVHYARFVEQWGPRIMQNWDAIRTASELGHLDELVPPNMTVLFVGNSHVGQLAMGFWCLVRATIVEWWATDLDGGCMARFGPPEDLGHECRDDPVIGNCGFKLARATLNNGARLLVAVNHPLLFLGAWGYQRALDVLGLTMSELNIMVIGDWNNLVWAKGFARNNFTVECGGQREPTMYNNGHQKSFLQFARKFGFSGTFIKSTKADIRAKTTMLPGNLSFSMTLLPHYACVTPTCLPGAKQQHACMPGEPDLYAWRFLELFQRWARSGK